MMVDITIDMDNIFHRIYSVIKRKPDFREDMRGRNWVIEDVAKFCNSMIRKIPHRGLWMAMDSDDTWRKDRYMPYKGTRTGDKVFLRSCMDEYAITHDKDGGCILKFPKYEGDDIITGLVEINANRGVSTVIISSDSDLNQLVKYEEGKPFVVQYDPDSQKRWYYIDHKYVKQEPDMFNDVMIDDMNTYTDGEHKLIDPHAQLIIKLLSGDKGDNVPSCYTNINGKNRSLGETSAIKVAAVFGKLDNYFDILGQREIASKVLKVVGSTEVSRINEIVDNIRRNLDLIHLSSNSIYQYADLVKSITNKIKTHANY